MNTRLGQAHEDGTATMEQGVRTNGFTGFLSFIDGLIARAETLVAGLLALVIVILLLINVATRTFGMPLFWVDELAIYAMVWMGFLGASLAIHYRQHIAVTVCIDFLPIRAHMFMLAIIDAMMLFLFVVLAVFVWQWFDPIAVLQADSLSEIGAKTFNFIYDEPTTTLGVRKFWFWLILPVFCVFVTIHSVKNLVDSVRTFFESAGAEVVK
ncbi:TRAP transporter small permease [Paenochrobactrum glaciei]|uniref:TRAP transporter small permease protein n=1 Tax=Paenochrobactrum glaciei TaxID=486407 RepID=A0ABP3QQ27_9HYPH